MKKILCFLMLAMPTAGLAQEPGQGLDHQLILQLLSRIEQLESEVRQMKQAAPAGTPTESSAPVESNAAASTALTATALASAAQAAAATTHDMSVPGLQPVHVQGFSDVQYQASDLKGQHNSFGLGQFNLFITNRLSNKLGLLGELVVESDLNNTVGVELERLLFQYTANDYFALSAGRYHTAIGYYNTAYHHSSWLQSAVGRPLVFAFEDGGGILPIHNVGLSATGRLPLSKLGLHYIAEIGNGRASRTPSDEAVQNRTDENNGKAVNLGIYSRPQGIPGFQTGFSLYRDSLHPEGIGKIGQTIFAGHVVYQQSGLEFLNEAIVLRHAVQGGGVFHIPAFYSQVSKRMGEVRPYFRYEYMNVPRAEPLYSDIGLRHGPVGGLRFDFNEFAAYKLEFFRDMERNVKSNGLRTQVSFTF